MPFKTPSELADISLKMDGAYGFRKKHIHNNWSQIDKKRKPLPRLRSVKQFVLVWNSRPPTKLSPIFSWIMPVILWTFFRKSSRRSFRHVSGNINHINPFMLIIVMLLKDRQKDNDENIAFGGDEYQYIGKCVFVTLMLSLRFGIPHITHWQNHKTDYT